MDGSGRYRTVMCAGGMGYDLSSSDYGSTYTPMQYAGSIYARGFNSYVIAQGGQVQMGIHPTLGVLRSDDYGNSFSLMGVPSNISTLSSPIWATINADAQAGIIVLTENSGKYITVSQDGGKTWQSGTAPMSQNGNAVVALPSNAAFLASAPGYGGFHTPFLSLDFGQSWSTFMLPPQDDYQYATVSTPDSWIVATKKSGIYRSTDQGGSWSIQPLPPTDSIGFQHAMDTLYGGKYQYLQNDTRIYASTDFGNSWQLLSVTLPNQDPTATLSSFSCIAADVTGRYVVLGTDASGVFLSQDFGATWQNTSFPVLGTPYDAVLISSTATPAGATELRIFGVLSNTVSKVGLVVSMDAGQTVTLHTPSPMNAGALTSATAQPNYVYVTGTAVFPPAIPYQYFLYRSIDGGASFAANTSLAVNMEHVACSGNGQYVAVSSQSASYTLAISTDYGATFVQKDLSGLPFAGSRMYAIAWDETGDVLLLLTYQGAFVSSDHGQTFSQAV